MTNTQKKVRVVALVAGQTVLAAFAWRDLTGRTDDQIRGKRAYWRAFLLLNPGNSLFYWLFGRR